MTDPCSSRVYFESSTPILRVEDMKAALAFYVDKLGFQNASWGTEDFTSVNRDRAGIYLCRGGQGRGGGWVWVGVEDATKLHDELVARGVAIRMPLSNFSWALEFQVEDPDGNVLRFGSEPIAGNRIENCLSSCRICQRFDSIAEVAQCTDHAQCAHSLGLLAHRRAS